MHLLCLLVAGLIGQALANLVTPLAATATTFILHPETPTASLSSTVLPPSSPELPEPTSTDGSDAPNPVVDGGGSEITAEPDPDDHSRADIKYVQTTYYSCVTIGSYSHCGWHMPILESGVQKGGDGVSIAIRAGAVALVAGTVMALR